MVIVGLTGSVGTGKSTVAGLFSELGAHVIDWDELARQVTAPHSKAWEEIVDHFGKHILNDDSTINRRRLADIVFSDDEELSELNHIIHPRVFEEDERMTNEITRCDPEALIIKDIPLLFETTRPVSVDKVVVVSASEEGQLRRLEQKGMSRQDARKRIESQLPLVEKVGSADFVIDNDGPLRETKRQVEKVYALLMKGNQPGQ